ncbi:ribosome-releasing factor 2-like protein [Leptotrombidium deliense]|uniref:Ribosome-releasing factor 2-like protein n=1 Tax=Leptotrombidium deliense TaxID=299467 RepID=A0A443SW86_9ACAR|nr:ribosome-releasing factor 2-like protein [Leptotrombidium deliense]
MNARRLRLIIKNYGNYLHRYFSSESADLSRIRTIGVIAHVDAGKTTTTERMLYYSGLTHSIGEVHHGDTITDYLPQERERGITITSAAVNFSWKKHTISLLDTPGHVDFTVEVERCLSVMDGAVVILDSSAGVEAQTATVWRQSDRFQLCKIIYLNKMDKEIANVPLCIKSLRELGSKPVLVHVPMYRNGKFSGVVDVTDMQKYIWSDNSEDGKNFQKTPLESSDSETFDKCCRAREELIETVCEYDTELSEAVISSDNYTTLSSSLILNALRRATIENRIQPVLCGSSYKNIGVQLLMDAVLKYLPSPVEKQVDVVKYYDHNLCVLVFKIIHHKILGALTFARIYSGKLTSASRVYNINRDSFEKVQKLYIPFADEFKEVFSVSAGNIVAISGLRSAVTGDTLTSSVEASNQAKDKYSKDMSIPKEMCQPVLAGIEAPVPVYFCSIEAPSPSKQKELEKALECLQREDPSLTVKSHSEQMVICGMGELHLQIVKDRILKEYKIEAFLGPLQIAYLESTEGTVEENVTVDKTVGGVKNVIDITLRIKHKPGERSKRVKFIPDEESEFKYIRPNHQKAVENGVSLALNNGPILGYPVVDVEVELLYLKTNSKASDAMIAAAASQCVNAALKKSNSFLMEPLMTVDVTLPENHVKQCLLSLSMRRATIGEMESREKYRIVHALVPLSEMDNFSTEMRTSTSGSAILSMNLFGYQKMSEYDQNKAIQSIVGF